MNYRLLMIDDDEDIRLILASVLASVEDLTILEAEKGATALALLADQTVDGIILDYRLPDMSGEDLLEQLTTSGRAQLPKIVMLSARDDPELTERWLNLGASAVLKKPFNPFELLAELRVYLEF